MAFDPTAFPYDTIVRVTDTIGGQNYQASGVLISPDEVLTASHVVYTQGVGTASNLVVTPAYTNGTAPFGSAYGTNFHYFAVVDANSQLSNYQSQFDYAVIHLSSSFPALGYMGLEANYTGGTVTVAGYPGSATGTMVASTQSVSLDPNYALLDGTALGQGSSGGPVFVGGAGSPPKVVGLVSTEITGTRTAYNVQITTQVYNQIEQWVAQDGSTPSGSQPPVTVGNASVAVTGAHTQYIIANNSGSLYFQDLVANRDGSQTVPGVDEIVFSDGVGRFDGTGNAENVDRLYGVAFGRGADLAGLNYWTSQIDSGSLGLSNVAMAFVGSTEFRGKYGSLSNQNFVAQLYQNSLGRTGDAAGVAYWTNQLNAGVSEGAVLTDFSDSFEYRLDTQASIGDKDMSEGYRLYQAAFGRTPDSGGLAYWVGVLDSGTSPLQVAQGMTGTAEFASVFAGLSATAEVNLLYENTFHGAGDPGGVNYWVGQLQGGASMGQVLLGFADSLQNRTATAGATHDGWVFTTA